MKTFSERVGEVKPPDLLQVKEMNQTLRNRLMNFCETYIIRPMQRLDTAYLEPIEMEIIDKLKRNYGSCYLLKRDSKHIDINIFRSSFTNSKWFEVYTIIETLIPLLKENFYRTYYIKRQPSDNPPGGISDPWYIQSYFREKINEILETENSGYRISDDMVFFPITSETELKEVKQTQKCEIESVRNRFNHAVSLFSDREKPDYPNAVKEAISAMESLAQYYTENQSGTLGELITSKKICMKTPQLISLPQPLKDAMSKLYGYASNEGDVRHSNNESEHIVTFNEAKFIIVTASALINYIIALNPTKKVPEK